MDHDQHLFQFWVTMHITTGKRSAILLLLFVNHWSKQLTPNENRKRKGFNSSILLQPAGADNTLELRADIKYS